MAQAKAKAKAKPSAKKSGGDNHVAGLIDRKIGALMRARRLELGIAQQKSPPISASPFSRFRNTRKASTVSPLRP